MDQNRILVAYATTHGATKEAAERIGAVLRQPGFEVEILEAGRVRSLDGYDAVVLGTALYMFKMHKNARRFLTRFRRRFMEGLPLAVFAGGPMEADKVEEQMVDVRDMLEKELAAFPDIRPKAQLVIGGRFDPAALKFPYNLIPAMNQVPAVDLRDWDEISAWAESLSGQLFED